MTIFLSSPRCRPIRILSAQADDLPGALPLDPVRNPPPHLHAIAVSFGAIGFHTPNRPAARRAVPVQRLGPGRDAGGGRAGRLPTLAEKGLAGARR